MLAASVHCIAKTKKYNPSHAYLLLLERARGKQVGDLLDAHQGDAQFWSTVLFEVIWTLRCFKDVGLMHNDLHSGNVFVDELPQPIERYFVLNN